MGWWCWWQRATVNGGGWGEAEHMSALENRPPVFAVEEPREQSTDGIAVNRPEGEDGISNSSYGSLRGEGDR